MSHQYKHLPADQLEALFSTFLVDSWSYSKVQTFARHEKAFEMQYIFGLYGRITATTVAGNAYHNALQMFFTQLKVGELVDLVDLERSAFEYIQGLPANRWKLSKTTKTVEEAEQVASVKASQLLRNFISEKDTYLENLAEVLEVEVYFTEFITVNGVDIPIPCNGKIDLVIYTRDGKLVIVDHKSRAAYTDEQEATLSIGVQAMTYVLGYEAKTGKTVDEVWFIENKPSQNKDKSAQLQSIKVPITENNRRLYEALLYEPLKRMISAVRDPDYIYLINDADNYVDRSELYDFWCRTMICEVEDFNVEESKKILVARRLKKVRDSAAANINPSVIRRFKESAATFIQYDLSDKNMTQQEKIEHALRAHGIIVQVAHCFDGYSSNTYLLSISAGVKIASIYSHRLDIANALDVANVRMSAEMVVYEGKSYMSVECAKKRDKSLDFDPSLRNCRKLPVGKDNLGEVIYWDLDNHSTPHVLVCGATGSGKSVFLFSTIAYALDSDIDEVIVFDPKYEFSHLQDNNRIFVYNDILEIEEQMANLVTEMEQLVVQRRTKRIVVVFDEFADAVANSRKGPELDVKDMVQVGNYAPEVDPFGFPVAGAPKMKLQKVGELKSLEENLRILLQKGRSSGFRIIAATQRASVKVITGDAKVNFPVQICFRVPKEQDSRVVLDEPGAESLAGMGDGLIKSPHLNGTVRFQAFYKQ